MENCPNPLQLSEVLHEAAGIIAARAQGGKVEGMMSNMGRRTQEITHGSLEAIQHRPIPIMALGLGLGWILARSIKSRTIKPQGLERMYPVEPGTGGALPEELYQSGLEDPGGRDYREGGDLASSSPFQKVFTSSRETANTIREKTSHLVERVKHKSSHDGGNLLPETKEKRSNLARLYDENPMAIAAALFTLGAFIGLMTPEMRKERELIGKVRQRVDNRLRGFGHETLEKVEDVAREAVRAAKKEAGIQNLTRHD